MHEGESDRPSPGAPGFRTTRWSLVAAASGEGSAARASLEELCTAYWYPLYAWLRRRGDDAARAEDLIQGFFADLLERRDLALADPARGRFRAFLLGALRHHVAHVRDAERAEKRGGGRAPLSIDWQAADARWAQEPAVAESPERAFERAWALATLERALERLGADYARRGQVPLFEALRSELAPGAGTRPRAVLAAELGLTEGALKVAVHRLRERFGAALRAEVLETLRRPEELDEELAALLEALSA